MTFEAQPVAVARASADVGTIDSSTLKDIAGYVAGLDALRFFAASIVTIYHLAFWAWAYPQGQVAQASKGVADFSQWDDLTSGGWAGVQIFFVISGFVIATSSERSTAIRFLISRFVRLVPGVWVCATITLIAWYLIDIGAPSSHLYTYTRSLLLLPTQPWIDSVYWTLGVEIAFYASVFVLLAMRRSEWLMPMVGVIGVASSLFWIVFTIAGMQTHGQTHGVVFSIGEAIQRSRLGELLLLKHGVFFAMGVFLWLRLIKGANVLPWLMLFAIGGCLQIASESLVKIEKTGLSHSPLLPCALWLVSLAWIWVSTTHNASICRGPSWSLQTLRRLGLMTYPLYLLHNVTGGAIMGAVANLGLPTGAALWIAIALIMALSWWVSRVPEPALQRFAKRMLGAIGNRSRVPPVR